MTVERKIQIQSWETDDILSFPNCSCFPHCANSSGRSLISTYNIYSQILCLWIAPVHTCKEPCSHHMWWGLWSGGLSVVLAVNRDVKLDHSSPAPWYHCSHNQALCSSLLELFPVSTLISTVHPSGVC